MSFPQSKLEERLNRINLKEKAVTYSYDEIKTVIRPIAQERLQIKLGSNFDRRSEAIRNNAKGVISLVIDEHYKELAKPLQLALVDEMVDDLLGYGPLEPFFNDPEVTEIKVLRWDHIRVEKFGQETKIKGTFRDEQHCRDILERMLAPTGRRIDYTNPRVGARLPDGSRMMAHIPPVAVEGTTFSIRRFTKGLTPEKLLENKMFSEEMLKYIELWVKGALNIIITGGTSTGKTTTLNALSSFIPEDESIITIEDPAEMILQHENVRRWEAKPPNAEGAGEVTMRDLLADALRAAPKRIIVGECRKGEAFDMMQAMGTGHPGSMTTGHANSADEALNARFPNMVQMADMGLPYEAIIRTIAGAIDLIIHIEKDRDGTRRVTEIVETVGVAKEDDVVKVASQKLFQYDYASGQWDKVAKTFYHNEQLSKKGVSIEW